MEGVICVTVLIFVADDDVVVAVFCMYYISHWRIVIPSDGVSCEVYILHIILSSHKPKTQMVCVKGACDNHYSCWLFDSLLFEFHFDYLYFFLSFPFSIQIEE